MGRQCMEKFYESLREHTIKIINFKKKKLKLLTNEHQESYENAKICYICQVNSEDKHAKDKKCCKVRDYCYYAGEYRVAAHRICSFKYNIPQ